MQIVHISNTCPCLEYNPIYSTISHVIQHTDSHVFLYALIYIVLYSMLYALCFIHGYFLHNYFHGILHLQQRSPAGHDWLQLIVAALNSLPPCHILLLFSFEVLNLYCCVTLNTRSVHQFLIRSCP